MIVLVADPPWRFGDSLPGDSRGASKQYATMTVAEIMAMDLPLAVQNASDAVLFLWRVSAMQQEPLDVIAAWRFKLKTELVWEKRTRTDTADHFGMGRIVRASHETCLIATRGKCPPAVRNIRSRFSAPVRAHSQKPEKFYALVERLYPHASKHELFSRTFRPGWAAYGNEIGKIERDTP